MNDLPPIIEPFEGGLQAPAVKSRGRQWQKGQSGNPKGMPRGSRHKTTLLLEGLLGKRGPDLVEKAIELGLSGDAACLKVCLDKLLPSAKSRPFKFKLQPLHTISDAQGALAAIIEGTTRGEILADEAATLSGIISSFVRTIEVSEIESRLAALEAANTADQPAVQYNA